MRDRARTGADIAVAMVPVIGGSLQSLLRAILQPSFEKRQELWLSDLGEVVEEIRNRVEGFDTELLAENEAFASAVIEASRIAMGTHLEAKLELLKNALINLALNRSSGDFLDKKMFRWVDELSPEHFLVLAYLENPRGWYRSRSIEEPNLHMGSPSALMAGARLEIAQTELEIVLRDLDARGLARVGSMKATMTGEAAWQPLLTDLGIKLLNFVRLT